MEHFSAELSYGLPAEFSGELVKGRTRHITE